MTQLPTEYNQFNSAGNGAGNWHDLLDVIARAIAEGDALDLNYQELGLLAVKRDTDLITEYHYGKEFFLLTIDAVNEWIEQHPSYKNQAA